MMGATRGACPLAHGKRHLGHFVSTRCTRFAAGIPTIHDDDRLPALGRFVFELTAKFAKAHIRDGAGQLVISEHPRHVQILDGDDIEPIDEIGRQLMQRMIPDIRNPGMEPGDAPLGFPHVLRPGDVHAFRNGFAGLQPGTDFGGVHLATELLR